MPASQNEKNAVQANTVEKIQLGNADFENISTDLLLTAFTAPASHSSSTHRSQYTQGLTQIRQPHGLISIVAGCKVWLAGWSTRAHPWTELHEPENQQEQRQV